MEPEKTIFESVFKPVALPPSPRGSPSPNKVAKDDVQWLDSMVKLSDMEQQIVVKQLAEATRKHSELVAKMEQAEKELAATRMQVSRQADACKQLTFALQVKKLNSEKFTKLWGIHKTDKTDKPDPKAFKTIACKTT